MLTSMSKDERGQTLPLVALFLFVLLGLLALAIDGGFAYAQRRYMQNAADAGALSAMTSMVNGETRDWMVRQTADDYAQRNRATSSTLTYLDAAKNVLPDPTNGLVPSNAEYVRVTASTSFATFFARAIGITSMTASAQATAGSFAAPSPWGVSGLAPLGVPENFYNACAFSLCDLWDSTYFKEWGVPAGQFKTLIDLSDGTIAGSDPTLVSQWTYSGYPGEIHIDDWLPAIQGNFGNNVADALRQRIMAQGFVDARGIWGFIDIVIWRNFMEADNQAVPPNPMQVQVLKFGHFQVHLSDIRGSQAYGQFIDYVSPGHNRGGGDPAGPRVIILID